MQVTYKAMGYSLSLWETGKTDSMGKAVVGYRLVDPDGDEIFQGADFHCSPMHDPESEESARSLLGFLTCQPGDVEADYFEGYTPEQREWSKSFDCEQLALWAMDDESPEPFDEIIEE